MHLFRTESTHEVHIHPDGEHGKQFDFRAWLARQGFVVETATGKTAYGGTYKDARGRTIVITPRSGCESAPQLDPLADSGNALKTIEKMGLRGAQSAPIGTPVTNRIRSSSQAFAQNRTGLSDRAFSPMRRNRIRKPPLYLRGLGRDR